MGSSFYEFLKVINTSFEYFEPHNKRGTLRVTSYGYAERKHITVTLFIYCSFSISYIWLLIVLLINPG